MNAAENFKINLNQNLWGMILSFASLGLAEYFHLNMLFNFSLVSSIVFSVSVLITTSFYTWNYCKNKSQLSLQNEKI